MKESLDAGKARQGKKEALELARHADRIIAVRRSKIVVLDMKNNPPDEETLPAHLLGPTGTLRAPTVRKGKTLLVGFNPEAYGEVLGELANG